MRRIIFLVVVLLVAVGGCGGDGDVTWGWSPVEVAPEVMGDESGLQGLAWLGSQWVATGYAIPEWMLETADYPHQQKCWWEYRDECSSSVLSSSDGVSWRLLGTLEPGSHMNLSSAGGGVGYGWRWAMDPIQGMLRPRPAVWWPSDEATWSRVRDPVLDGSAGQMYGLAEGPTGLVGVGFDCPDPGGVDCWESLGFWDSRPAIWTTADGLAWSRAADDSAVFLEGRLLGVAFTPWGWIAVGEGTASAAEAGDTGNAQIVPEGAAVAYISLDAVTWARLDLPDRSDGGLCSRANAVAVLGERVVISGACWKQGSGGESRVPGAWITDDGVEWTLIESFDGDTPRAGGKGLVIATESGLLMVGSWAEDMRVETSHFSVWVSRDGTTWEQTIAADPGWWIGNVAAHDEVVVAVGAHTHDEDTERAHVWIGTAD